jgi:short-subunit dehydrogenase
MTAKNPYQMPFLMDAEVFAAKALTAIQHKRSYVVIPWQMGVVGKLMRLLPNWLYDRLAVNAPRKPRKAG